jgi:hypothetical protein
MSKTAKNSQLNQNLSWNVANSFQFFSKIDIKLPQKKEYASEILNFFFCIHVKFCTKEKGWLGFWSSCLGPLNIGVHSSYCLLGRRWWGCFKNTGWWWCHCRSSVFDISNEILRHLETNIDEVLKDLTRNLIVSVHAIPGLPASSNLFQPSIAQLLITATTARNRPFVYYLRLIRKPLAGSWEQQL